MLPTIFPPQPRVDRDKGGGMTVTVGRIRKDPIIENGIKYVCLAHNTKLGAAKALCKQRSIWSRII